MNKVEKVAVCSKSFSRNAILRDKLQEKYKFVTFNDQGVNLKGKNLIQFLADHHKAIIGLEKVDESLLAKSTMLKVISKYGVGLDMIDLEAMKKYEIKLGWKGGVNRRSVSELVLSNAINLLRFVPIAQQEVINGEWRQQVGRLLSGKTVGIVGCGFVGKDLVKLLVPFKCKILVYDIKKYKKFYDKFGIKAVTLDELLLNSDIITLHVPLNETTENILNANKMKLIKPTSILINAARGGLIDEVMLKQMLKDKSIAGAALDVFFDEPPIDKELLNLPNFLPTPHIGGSSEEAVLAMGYEAIKGLDTNSIPYF